MVGRALGLGAVMLTLCMAGPIQAQENLEAGKSPSQIFAGTCVACHKSPRGLVKSTAPGSLPGFLRQHYTTSPEMAGVLANYLLSNGATDARYMGKGKDGKEAKPDPKPESRSETGPGGPEQAQPSRRGRRHHPAAASEVREAAPESEGAASQNEPAPRSGHRKRMSRHGAATQAGTDADGQQPAAEHPAVEGRRSVTKRKHGKPSGDDASKPDASAGQPSDAALEAPKTEPSRTENTGSEDRVETPKVEAPATESSKTRESAVQPADPVPPAAAPTVTQSIPTAPPPSSAASDPAVPSSPASH
ncbi:MULTISPECIES: hypothetical protein [unclassified Bradyrhizobium]|uniref:hypothetical protein n=1 Tax=unclassified Bradyrhizobium TaxID=2631580 RepID=UPI002915C9E3|nr:MULTISPECIES: hypothetical protein [unclassified Bradyrhizobium]